MIDNSYFNAPTFGSELVTNGTMEVDTTGWTNNSGATFERNTSSPITGTGDLHWVGGGTGYTSVRQTSAISVVSGKTYNLTYDYRVVGTDYISAKLSESTSATGAVSDGFVETELDETSNTSVSYTFVSGATQNVYLMFRSGDNGSPEIYVDNVSIKEVQSGSILGWSGKESELSYETTSPITASGSLKATVLSSGNSSSGPYQDIGMTHLTAYKVSGKMRLVSGSSSGKVRIFSSESNGTSQKLVYSDDANTLYVGGPVVPFSFIFYNRYDRPSIQFACDVEDGVFLLDDV